MEKLGIEGGTPVWSAGWPEWPVHDEREIDAVTRVMRSGKWWRGAYGTGVELVEPEAGEERSEVVKFQGAFARHHDCQYGIAACNGTVTLEISLRALGVGPGDEVIVPAYTFFATASAVLAVNAAPIFVDIEPDTYNIDPARAAEAMTEKTRAIIPVHFGGQPADMSAINATARESGLAVIEDAAHAHGAVYQGRKCGSLGDAGSFSFQASKPMTAGEGGMITTNRTDIAEECESLVWAGRRKGHPWYRHFLVAGNARMTEFQGAILSVQLSRLDQQARQRMENARLLDQLLRQIEGVKPCALRPETDVHGYHLYMFRYSPEAFCEMAKAEFVDALVGEGIGPAMGGYVAPLYQNPAFLDGLWARHCLADYRHRGRKLDYADFAEKCPVAERACATEAIWLTQNALMGGEAEIHAIADAIAKVQRCARPPKAAPRGKPAEGGRAGRTSSPGIRGDGN